MEAGRPLTSEEISQLITQRCKAEDWNRILVSRQFQVKYVTETTFSGDIYLGRFGKILTLPGGVPVESGIFKAHLHNCEVADDVYISHVSQYIANYSLGEGTIIENIGALYTEGESSFGNGTSASVLDETGGRAVTLYEGLSAQTAWVAVMNFYRHKLISALNRLAMDKARSVRSTKGKVGAGCSIRNSGTLRNLRIGDGCEINGASLLDDGSLCSSPSIFQGEGNESLQTSAYVGSDVIARHFIFAPGSVVKDGVQLERCFVGEAAEVSKGFSAHDSLFFANCQMENGEACASFVGPYAVSMHKGTLMVGGMFSFCNFGSSSNQSNHFYKLGPMHSGILERGCKTGSGAYVLWPARIGAFTFIKGSHLNHPVTTDFPFSFLLEDSGKSYLTPGTSLRSIGTLRDELKWPQRDKRTSMVPADKICFDSYNIQIATLISNGLSRLRELASRKESEYVLDGFTIRSSAVVKGIKLYQSALDICLGSLLLHKLDSLLDESESGLDLLNALLAENKNASTSWNDLSGLLVPEEELQTLFLDLENGFFKSTEALENAWEEQYRRYDELAWKSSLNLLARSLDKPIESLTKLDFEMLIDRWQSAFSSMLGSMLLDADYELGMMHLHAPGGEKPEHPFVKIVARQQEELSVRAAQIKACLKD
jgi:hypothetical protein